MRLKIPKYTCDQINKTQEKLKEIANILNEYVDFDFTDLASDLLSICKYDLEDLRAANSDLRDCVEELTDDLYEAQEEL